MPDSLRNLVPKCTDLAIVWTKLDDKFLDLARVWKAVQKDLASLNRKKLGEALVGKLQEAESLLETV